MFSFVLKVVFMWLLSLLMILPRVQLERQPCLPTKSMPTSVLDDGRRKKKKGDSRSLEKFELGSIFRLDGSRDRGEEQ